MSNNAKCQWIAFLFRAWFKIGGKWHGASWKLIVISFCNGWDTNLHMTQCRILGKLRYTWGPNFKVVLLMILVCQVHYYNIGSTLHKYECREMDIWLDICDIWFYKKGPLKSSKMLQLAWNFFWLDKIKIYCHLSFTNFSVRQVLNWFFLRYLPYWYLQGSCCKIVNNNQICVKFVLRGNYKILLTPLLL